MKHAMYFDFQKYREYRLFLETCLSKKYDENVVLHSHHIIPKHLWYDTEKSVNDSSNLIKLSVEDHINAHLLLSECYESETYEHISNLRSARLLSKKSIKDKNILEKISKTYTGELNPFYGKEHSAEIKKNLSEKTKLQCSGVSYEERYGDSAELEKQKRVEGVKKSWQKMTDRERKERSSNISKSLKGKMSGSKNPFATKLLVNGIYFGSRKEACETLNVSPYLLYKKHNVKKINK